MSTLSDDELWRVKAELLDNVLGFGAVPYFNIRHVYEVIQDNVTSSSVSPTTSSTTVTAAGPTTITLASATGYATGQRIQVDADASRETVTLRNLAGAVASVICQKTHSGTYPVEVESGLTIVRGLLADLTSLEQVNTLDALKSLGIKQVDEVVFFGRADGGGSVFDLVQAARARLRAELASRCGLAEWLASAMAKQAGGGSYEQY